MGAEYGSGVAVMAMNLRMAASTFGPCSGYARMTEPWPRRTISSRLSSTRTFRYIARAAPRNGWSSSADTNSTGTRSRGIAAQAFTAPKAPGPERLTIPATGGWIRVAAASTAVAPIEEPISTILSAPRRRSCLAARDDVGYDSRVWPGSWPGVAEALEVKGEGLALLGDPSADA